MWVKKTGSVWKKRGKTFVNEKIKMSAVAYKCCKTNAFPFYCRTIKNNLKPPLMTWRKLALLSDSQIKKERFYSVVRVVCDPETTSRVEPQKTKQSLFLCSVVSVRMWKVKWKSESFLLWFHENISQATFTARQVSKDLVLILFLDASEKLWEKSSSSWENVKSYLNKKRNTNKKKII